MQVLITQAVIVALLFANYFRIAGYQNIEIREGRRSAYSNPLRLLRLAGVILASLLPVTAVAVLVAGGRH